MKKKYILSYDVHYEHQRIIDQLIANGWHSILQGVDDNGSPCIGYLPETTWCKELQNSSQALNEFKTIAGNANVVRAVVSNFDDWRCTTGNPMNHQKEEVRKL